MILKQIWISMIFQVLWEPCLRNKLQWNIIRNSYISPRLIYISGIRPQWVKTTGDLYIKSDSVWEKARHYISWAHNKEHAMIMTSGNQIIGWGQPASGPLYSKHIIWQWIKTTSHKELWKKTSPHSLLMMFQDIIVDMLVSQDNIVNGGCHVA